MIIGCPIHGWFKQKAYNHCVLGHGCDKCARELKARKLSLTTEEFIKRSKEAHGDKFDYSQTEYINSGTKLKVICRTHGEFEVYPFIHMNPLHITGGCHECHKECISKANSHTRDEIIELAKEVHSDKYDYSLVDYKGYNEYIDIICPIHGKFSMSPHTHISSKCGCPTCSASKLEIEIESFLKENDINYQHRVRKDKLIWIDNLEADFYLPDYNVIIECQGLQHFEPINFGSTIKTKEECYERVLYNDEKKRHLCQENGFRIFYYSNLHIEYPYFVYEDKEEMLKDIINN